jgi:ribosome recycling factor
MASRLLRSVATIQTIRPVLRVATRPAAVQFAWQKPVFTTVTRSYAKKSKDSKKKANKDDSKIAAADEEEEDVVRQFNESQIVERYEHSISSLKEHLANMRVGRANPCKLIQ